jgi:hypothetical protein
MELSSDDEIAEFTPEHELLAKGASRPAFGSGARRISDDFDAAASSDDPLAIEQPFNLTSSRRPGTAAAAAEQVIARNHVKTLKNTIEKLLPKVRSLSQAPKCARAFLDAEVSPVFGSTPRNPTTTRGSMATATPTTSSTLRDLSPRRQSPSRSRRPSPRKTFLSKRIPLPVNMPPPPISTRRIASLSRPEVSPTPTTSLSNGKRARAPVGPKFLSFGGLSSRAVCASKTRTARPCSYSTCGTRISPALRP